MSPKLYLSLIKSKNLSKEEKNKLKKIIKHFQNNIITTNELYKLDKKFPLNSLTESNFFFLSHESRTYRNRNNGKNKNEDDKFFLTCSNMIGQFNTKTNKILDKSNKDMKFSKNKDAFRKQIINFYSDSDKKK